MSEIATSATCKNNLLYGVDAPIKNMGPASVDNKGEEVLNTPTNKPSEAPVYAVREK